MSKCVEILVGRGGSNARVETGDVCEVLGTDSDGDVVIFVAWRNRHGVRWSYPQFLRAEDEGAAWKFTDGAPTHEPWREGDSPDDREWA